MLTIKDITKEEVKLQHYKKELTDVIKNIDIRLGELHSGIFEKNKNQITFI